MDTSRAGELTTAGHRSSAPPRLVGRATELAAVHAFLDDAAVGGGALVLSGGPGAGKTALLDAAVRRARCRDTTVLRGRGDAARADVAFGFLAGFLRPIRHGRLDRSWRAALAAAVGRTGGLPVDRLRVRTATLAVLRHAGRERALLVAVDDLHHLDRESATTLAFVARRLAGSRVGLLAVCDSGDGGAGDGFVAVPAGLAQLPVPPLEDADAARLVREHVPDLPAHLVRRVLVEAAGNPLALRELAVTTARAERFAACARPAAGALLLPGTSPCLQERFAPRIRTLPAGTRRALLLAALGGDLDTMSSSAAHAPDLLEAAERAGLVDVGRSGTVRFRHPLVRATVHQLATPDERREAHRTIARSLVDRPERRLRHLSAATVAPDERLARLAQRRAWHVLGRGDAAGAVSLLVRAAELGSGGQARGRRLAGAAYVAAHGTGDLASAPLLLAAARRADPDHGSLYAAITQAYCRLHGGGELVAAHRLLVASLAGRPDLGRPDPASAEGLHVLVDVAAWAGRPDPWVAVREAVGRRGMGRSTELRLRVSVLADPARVSRPEAASVDGAIRSLVAEPDPLRIARVAALGLALDRVVECREPLRRALDGGRGGRAVAAAIAASTVLCTGDVATGHWDEAEELAEQGIELCGSGHLLGTTPLRLAQALMAAARGDEVRTRALVDAVVGWAAPRGVGTAVDEGRRVLALAALGRGDVEDAYRHATTVTPPGQLAAAGTAALRVSMDLIEAAVRLGRHDEARRHAQAMRDAPVHAVSPRFAMLTAASTALVADAETAAAWFEEALATPDADRWPFDQARVQLAYGEHLRRQRRTGPSRVFLGAALDTFERLGARPWAAQARHGLRASGLTIGRPVGPGAAAALTPDERTVAALAATGLTNKQIARQLMVSHHTVAARLYQAFPKLGVGSRAALRDAMLTLDGETVGRSDDVRDDIA